MKKIILALSFVVLAFSILALAAKPETVLAAVGPSGGKATVVIPKHAVEVSPGVFNLGTAVHDGKTVEGYMLIDKVNPAKPSGCNNDGKCQGWEDASCADCSGGTDPGASSCYGFLSKGAKWKTIEPYVVNPSNTEGLTETFVVDNLAADIQKWEDAAGTDILGSGSPTALPLEADTVTPDGVNEVYFGEIDDPGTIGVTIIWGVFRGPPKSRELVEWDQVYEQVDFDWSSTGEAGKMDFENIATHELGHSVGLDDLYETACSDQTMYGYATEGETKKRTLEAGDTTGVQELYK
jgi:hypothetical protein